VATANALQLEAARAELDHWHCDFDLWSSLTLKTYNVSPVTWWNFVPNFYAIEQSAIRS